MFATLKLRKYAIFGWQIEKELIFFRSFGLRKMTLRCGLSERVAP